MNLNFREIEQQLCIVLDTQIPKLLCPDAEAEANAIICYGYVDKVSGLTFEVLCIASYIEVDYTIVNENKSVSAKVRAEKFQNSKIITIKNAAIMKRFQARIQLIKDVYYSGAQVELMRNFTSLDKFRHPFYPDDIQAILLAEGIKPESIWVRLKEYILDMNKGTMYYEGELLNSPFDKKYNLTVGDSVYLIISEVKNGEVCFVIPKPNY